MLKKLLITGAAGGVGRLIAGQLGAVAETFRLSDIAPIENPEAEFVPCDLSDAEAVDRLVEGCDGILHLGGISVERSFDEILGPNLIGVHNIYEAARKHGGPRVLFASSNHVVGYYRQDEHLDATAAHQPDGWYGISKSYGEAVALMYHRKFGIESALVRIGSCFAEPKDRRMLATWMAAEDFVSLIERVFLAPRLGCPVIYGISNNDIRWWDNSKVAYLGWKPKRNSAEFAEKVEQLPMPAPDASVSVYQGGAFTDAPVHKRGN